MCDAKVIGNDRFESFIEKCMHLDTTVLSEINQTKKVNISYEARPKYK